MTKMLERYYSVSIKMLEKVLVMTKVLEGELGND